MLPLPAVLYMAKAFMMHHQALGFRVRHSKAYKLLMTFSGSVQIDDKSLLTDCLVDSGATHCFIDREFVADSNLKLAPDIGQVSCAGDNMVNIVGTTNVHLTVQRFSSPLRMIVLDLPPDDDLKIIIGQTWLTRFHANIDFDEQCVHYKQHDIWDRLDCPRQTCHRPRANITLNFNQYKRIARKKCARLFVVMVQTMTPEGYEIDERAQVLIDEYHTVFQKLPPGLPLLRSIGHTINTGKNLPVSKAAYRLSPK